MTIIDFFMPNLNKHIEAYYYLSTHGVWPEGFLPEDLEFPDNWQIELQAMMAKCWVQHMLLKGMF